MNQCVPVWNKLRLIHKISKVKSSRDDPPLQRILRRQAVLRVPRFVLLLRPRRLHQAQGGIQGVAAGVIGEKPQHGVAGHQAQAQVGLAALQRTQRFAPGQPSAIQRNLEDASASPI